MAKTQKVNAIAKAITYIVILVLIAGVIGVVAYFTNGFTTSFKTFYVVCEDKTIMERGSITLSADEDIRFDVKYTFSAFNKDKSNDFSVKIMPSVTEEKDFYFSVDGSLCAFSNEKDLSNAFGIKVYDTYFTINAGGNKTLSDILSRVYRGKTVDASQISAGFGYLTLVVTSYNGEANVYIDICVYSAAQSILIEGGDIVL